ncbi:hypothetical protein G7A66_13030 [Altererythrobacter sp. SALINAS58]|uniref:hypothetical protein n=1 Tax=Alteripontixanthobacter muriae TaxID=2705546 RepID=UPI001577596B|nr:hypothetical protein [Alteripontixanthobacter muriae]NTZ43987.1 hypothetical protein [Alteripontixanthobacter muriae]
MMKQSPDIRRVEQDLEDWVRSDLGPEPDATAAAEWVQARFARIAELDRLELMFEAQFKAALDEAGRHAAILDLVAKLGRRRGELARDARSLTLFFDREAAIERVRRRIGEEERAISFWMRRMGPVSGVALGNAAIQGVLNSAWSYTRDPRIRESGFIYLRLALEGGAGGDVSEAMLWQAQRASLQKNETVWIQCEALKILSIALPQAAVEIVRRRLSEPLGDDDFFVRRQAVRLVARDPAFDVSCQELFKLAMSDPSAAVRQCLAAELWRRQSGADAYTEALSEDPDPKVRATLLVCGPLLVQAVGQERIVRLLRSRLEQDQDSFAIRAALRVAAQWAWEERAAASILRNELDAAIREIYSSNPDPKVRRWAAEAAEQLWCAADPEARSIAKRISLAISTVKEGQIVALPGLLKEAERSGERLGRILSVLAQHGFTLELLPGGKIRHGELITFRSWRLLHEWRNPSSDKRQGFAHWTGRVWRGRRVAPSAIMAELAPTKVPGEPLFQPTEGNWRPWLPLPDLILSTIDTGEIVSVHSAEGITEIHPPRGFVKRFRARMQLTRNFANFAGLRNWTEGSGSPPSSYAEALRELGVKLVLKPNRERDVDPQVVQFFSFAPSLVAIPALWDEVGVYFSSLYANTLTQLAIFAFLATVWFFAKHVIRTQQMRRARRSLALVVGGWGTRGKSGTERLKAAVFSALGHPFVSKTTGNEAMFLWALPYGDIREMFLFRPYDKATIWEQLNLAVLASKLHAKIFLWECMGLAPAYVKVLQRHWMRDDIATITNTYPDHEDVQGPAGRNIPEVMKNFIPQNSRLITSEEQMRPILVEAARELDTSFKSVGWLEAGLIPDEMLSRFPYEEHPYNIALVTAMAAELGIDSDVAIKEMADRVVQDIGALKVYPEARVRTRRLEFVLGNSANERFGALGNWTRVGFDKQDPVAEPDVWISTVINNRADRVPRSRVFASIIVKDVSADRHVLIGSNLQGLQGFIEEAWNEFTPAITLWPSDREGTNPLEELKSWAKRLRVVHSSDQLFSVLHAMLCGQPEGMEWAAQIEEPEPAGIGPLIRESGLPDAEAIAGHYEASLHQLQSYEMIEKLVQSGGQQAEIDRQLREQAWEWFRAKIIVVENYYATGEEIVRLLAKITPPNFRNRIMGMQNIKGTGLDFVYRWHAWETVHRASVDALSEDPMQSQRGLETLAFFREYGILSAECVQSTVRELRSREASQGEIAEAQLDLVETQLREQLAIQEKGIDESRGGRWAAVIAVLEAFLDPGDAARRRKKADLIYRELASERISSARAVLELKKLNTRQKGGWLLKKAQDWRRRLGSP